MRATSTERCRGRVPSSPSRRRGLRAAGATGLAAALAAIGLADPREASAQSLDAAFRAKSLADALRALGVASPADASALSITAPDVAENGALVEVGLRSQLPKTESMALLVEKNPFPLAALYRFHEGIEPDLTMNVKMGESSTMVLVARADGRWYMTRRQVGVTVGGCG